VKADEAVLVVRTGGVLNGRAVLKRDGAGWRGGVHHGDGSKWRIAISSKEAAPVKELKRQKAK
jgi:hypothetical protein